MTDETPTPESTPAMERSPGGTPKGDPDVTRLAEGMPRIRQAAFEDFDILVDLYRAYAGEFGISHTPAETQHLAQRSLTQAGSYTWIARVDGEPAGLTRVSRRISTTLAAESWWLDLIYVLPKFRKHGVSLAIVTQVFQAAQIAGSARLELMVEPGNVPGNALCEHFGFHSFEHTVLWRQVEPPGASGRWRGGPMRDAPPTSAITDS